VSEKVADLGEWDATLYEPRGIFVPEVVPVQIDSHEGGVRFLLQRVVESSLRFGACPASARSLRRAVTTHGAGLRLLECVELRVKDISFDRGELRIRDGKGRKDRVTVLAASLKEPLLEHLQRVKTQREADLKAGRESVALPDALRLKYPNAPREWGWQWVFAAARGSFGPFGRQAALFTTSIPVQTR